MNKRKGIVYKAKAKIVNLLRRREKLNMKKEEIKYQAWKLRNGY